MNALLDTSIINAIAGGLQIERFESRVLCSSIDQIIEIANTSNPDRRRVLQITHNEITQIWIDPTTTRWGKFSFGVDLWGSTNGHFTRIKTRLTELQPKGRHTVDAAIGELAIVKGLTLWTCDRNLARAMFETHPNNVALIDYKTGKRNLYP